MWCFSAKDAVEAQDASTSGNFVTKGRSLLKKSLLRRPEAAADGHTKGKKRVTFSKTPTDKRLDIPVDITGTEDEILLTMTELLADTASEARNCEDKLSELLGRQHVVTLLMNMLSSTEEKSEPLGGVTDVSLLKRLVIESSQMDQESQEINSKLMVLDFAAGEWKSMISMMAGIYVQRGQTEREVVEALRAVIFSSTLTRIREFKANQASSFAAPIASKSGGERSSLVQNKAGVESSSTMAVPELGECSHWPDAVTDAAAVNGTVSQSQLLMKQLQQERFALYLEGHSMTMPPGRVRSASAAPPAPPPVFEIEEIPSYRNVTSAVPVPNVSKPIAGEQHERGHPSPSEHSYCTADSRSNAALNGLLNRNEIHHSESDPSGARASTYSFSI
eukprot:gene20784-27608_t